MLRFTSITILILTLIYASLAPAADPGEGKKKAAVCAACHGINGVSFNPLWPNLAGQQTAYLEKQLKDFREGRRTDASMSAMAKPLSDEDIANLAAYYSGLSAK